MAFRPKQTRQNIRGSDWPLGVLAVSVLVVYLFYTLTYVFQTPYPGFDLRPVGDHNGWDVDLADYEGAVVVQIGDLTFEEYLTDGNTVPFADHLPGETVELLFDDGRTELWRLPPATLSEQVRRFVPGLSFFAFWIAGTAVLLFLRPRDKRWRLLIAFHYLTAIWIVTGTVSAWQIAWSRQVLRSLSWLMVPVYLHLHLIVPSALTPRLERYLMPPLYAVAMFLAGLQLFVLPPNNLPLTALILVILVCFALLFYRFLSRATQPAVRLATRLMLTGIGLAFFPGIARLLLPDMPDFPGLGVVLDSVAAMAIPVVALFYTYAIYKRQLGQLEFRASRLLSLYSFTLFYPTAFVLVFLLINERIEPPEGRMLASLLVSITFVIAAPGLMSRFQRAVDRLAYGTEHNPDDLVRLFASRIPSALTRDALLTLLTHEITPSLLVRQSALYLYEESKVLLFYAQGASQAEIDSRYASRLIQEAGEYQPPQRQVADPFDWVRLVIPLKTRERTIGIWLFGRRDPDDFYPRNDINLLQILSNQIAPVIENIRLYEALQKQADRLAEQVAERTAELRAERDRTQAILDAAGEGIFFTDLEGSILYVNPAMELLTGYRSDETLGHTSRIWYGGATSSDSYEKMWTALHLGQEWSGELVSRRKDSSTYDVNLTMAPVHAQDNERTGFVGIVSDISRLKEVDRLKSLFVSNVSHELRTPLTNIKTYLSLLERGRAEKRSHYLSVVSKETERLARLIEDLLKLSRLDSGAVSIQLEPTDIDLVVTDVLNAFAAKAEGRRIELHKDHFEPMLSAQADPRQLDQVLTNLVGNAIAYIQEGGRVTVSAGAGNSNGTTNGMVWLRVADNGPGISSLDKPHLFERFFRGAAAQETGAPGTGLGLSICKEIMDRHRGEIEVENQPQGGAAFTIWLPAAEQVDLSTVTPGLLDPVD